MPPLSIAQAMFETRWAKSPAEWPGKRSWNQSITKDPIREAVQLASQALLRHADEFILEPAGV